MGDFSNKTEEQEPRQTGNVSRRNFLKGAVAGGVGVWALSPYRIAEAMLAGEAESRPIRGVGVEPGVVQIGSNENPIGASPRALEAVLKHMGSSNRYYRSNALVESLARVHSIPYTPQQRDGNQPRQADPILLAAGSGQTLQTIALTFLSAPGDEMVAAHPSYGSIERRWEADGGVVHRVPLTADYKHDLNAMLAKVNTKTKIVSICNPNNPTGTIVPYTEIEHVVNSVPKQTIVVVDEAYIEFVRDPGYKTSIPLAVSRENVIAVRTFSKIFGLAGVRVGYSVAHPSLHQRMLKYHYTNGIGVYGMVAAEAALEDYDHQNRSRELAIAMKMYFAAEFKKMGLEYIPSESNFMMVNLKQEARPIGQELAKRKVFTADADRRWGMKNWIRLSVGTQEESEAFIKALREILKPDKEV
ncbi:MAG: aminotransferase class I/II-fold pyridoxal phosphate-dependent enzyme [candidate division Zixibacteria bacterium]|nr:aminotransferase class I/II-fold pyridoxal phosphate-dependent enzyme [candidate division Zixibacteria bacterium]